MAYEKVFDNPYPDGWEDLPNETTPITASALQEHTDAIENIEDYLEDNPIQEWAQSETKPEYYSTEIKIQSVANPNYTQQDFNDGISAELQSIPFEYVSNETFGELSDDVDSLKESLTHQTDVGFLQRNLFDISKLTVGKVFNASGVVIDSDNNWGYGYIEIEPSKNYTISSKGRLWSSAYNVWLDSNKSFISRASTRYTDTTITVTSPSNAKYLGVSVCVASDAQYNEEKIFQVELGSVAHSYTPFAYGNTDLTKEIDNIVDRGYSNNISIYESNIQVGKVWDGNTNANRAVWDIDVKPSTQYTITMNRSAFSSVIIVEKTSKSATTQVKNFALSADITTFTTDASTNDVCIQYIKASAMALSDVLGSKMNMSQGSDVIPSNTSLKESLSQLQSSLTTTTYNGTSDYPNGANACVFYKSGNVVQVALNLYNATSTDVKGYQTLANCPTECKPSATRSLYNVWSPHANAMSNLYVNANGTIQFGGSSTTHLRASGYATIGFTYLI